jgi:hypothetical protein
MPALPGTIGISYMQFIPMRRSPAPGLKEKRAAVRPPSVLLDAVWFYCQ